MSQTLLSTHYRLSPEPSSIDAIGASVEFDVEADAPNGTFVSLFSALSLHFEGHGLQICIGVNGYTDEARLNEEALDAVSLVTKISSLVDQWRVATLNGLREVQSQ